MKNIDSSMVFEYDIEDLQFPEIKARETVRTAMEINKMTDMCESPYIGDDTRELLERDMEALQKKFDFIVHYPVKQEYAAHE